MIILTILFETVIFLLFALVFFYIPGKAFLVRFRERPPFIEDIFFATTFGIILFTLAQYTLSWIHAPFLVYPIVFVLSIYTLRAKTFPHIPKKNKTTALFVISLSLLLTLTIIPSGRFGDTVRLIGVNIGDSMWHLALINELRNHFPPDNPTFSGVDLKGYHFFYNFVLAMTSNLTSLSPMTLYYRMYPLLIALLWGSGVYVVMQRWLGSRAASLWAVFLTMFGGSFSFVLYLYNRTGGSLDDALGMTQPASSLVNPPFSISIVFILLFLYSLLRYQEKRLSFWLIPLSLTTGTITMFKVYAGIALMAGMGIFSFVELLSKRVLPMLGFFVSCLIFLLTYWVFTGGSASLIWAPLWSPHRVLLNNLPWYGYEEKQYTYSRLGVVKGMIEIELYGLYVFIIGSLGTRVFGLFLLPLMLLKLRKPPSLFSFILLIMLLVSIIIPLFFIQSIKVFETIQMSWYFLFFSALFSAAGLGWLFTRKYSILIKIFLTTIIVIFTLPSAYEKAVFYLTSPVSVVPKGYLEVTDRLSKNASYNNTILEIPPKYVGFGGGDVERWYGVSTPMIVGFANKRSFLNSPYIDFPGVDTKPRREFLKKLIRADRQGDQVLVQEVIEGLREFNVVYIFSPYPLALDQKSDDIQIVHEADQVYLYKVK